MKTCSNPKCTEINPQPEENYSIDKEGSYTWRRKRCKTCRFLDRKKWGEDNRKKFNAYMRKYNGEHKDSKKYKDRYKNRSLKKRYKITLGEFNEMLEAQKHTCLICERTTAQIKNRLVVDHCHSTGIIRGLLCHGCNRSLAFFDQPILLHRAMKYLKMS